MKKKLIIGLTTLLLLSAILFAGVSYAQMNAPKHPSEYHIGITYQEAQKEDKPVLAVFYVDWCSYCLKFMPKFNILSKIYRDKYNFVMINTESPENKKLVNDIGIYGYPTVYILDLKYDNRVLMPSHIYHDLLKFRTELDRYIRIRGLLDKSQEK